MTDFTHGAIITRDNTLWDGDRPSWVQDDAMVRCTCCGNTKPAGNWYSWNELVLPEIELDASDIVYRCIEWNEAHPDEPVMWPWYGGDEAPADYAVYGAVLYKNGSFWRKPLIEEVTWTGAIGYQRRPTTTSLPEPAEDTQLRASREPEAIGGGEAEIPDRAKRLIERIAEAVTTMQRDHVTALDHGEAVAKDCIPLFEQLGMTNEGDGWGFSEDPATPQPVSGDAVREALEALKPFAAVADYDIGEDETDAELFRPMSSRHNHAPLLTVGDLRRALATLAKHGDAALNHGGTQ